MAGKYSDVQVPRGTNFTILWPVSPPPDPDWTVDAYVRRRSGEAPIYTFPADKAVVTDAGVQLFVTAEMSTDWVWDSEIFDVTATLPSGSQLLIAYGTLQVRSHGLAPCISGAGEVSP